MLERLVGAALLAQLQRALQRLVARELVRATPARLEQEVQAAGDQQRSHDEQRQRKRPPRARLFALDIDPHGLAVRVALFRHQVAPRVWETRWPASGRMMPSSASLSALGEPGSASTTLPAHRPPIARESIAAGPISRSDSSR